MVIESAEFYLENLSVVWRQHSELLAKENELSDTSFRKRAKFDITLMFDPPGLLSAVINPLNAFIPTLWHWLGTKTYPKSQNNLDKPKKLKNKLQSFKEGTMQKRNRGNICPDASLLQYPTNLFETVVYLFREKSSHKDRQCPFLAAKRSVVPIEYLVFRRSNFAKLSWEHSSETQSTLLSKCRRRTINWTKCFAWAASAITFGKNQQLFWREIPLLHNQHTLILIQDAFNWKQ